MIGRVLRASGSKTRRRLLVSLSAAGLATLLGAGVGLPAAGPPAAVAVEPPTPSTTTAVTPPPADPGPAPTTLPPPSPLVGDLAPGAQGDAVRSLQERLVRLHYDPGTVDGRYGIETALAVMAFQKVTGLPRTGVATAGTLLTLGGAADPTPMVPTGEATRVEVDMARQVLFVWAEGALVKILPVSTGNGQRYCAQGVCDVAVTPQGTFRVERRIAGLRRSALGVLYNPLYFKGGFAIHGSPSIPPQPASHGCVRIPIHSSRWLLDHVPDATPVHLVAGWPTEREAARAVP